MDKVPKVFLPPPVVSLEISWESDPSTSDQGSFVFATNQEKFTGCEAIGPNSCDEGRNKGNGGLDLGHKRT